MNKILTNIIELLMDSLTAMYMFNCCFIPTDQTKRTRLESCIIHCSDDESLLVSPKDLDSWKSLFKEA